MDFTNIDCIGVIFFFLALLKIKQVKYNFNPLSLFIKMNLQKRWTLFSQNTQLPLVHYSVMQSIVKFLASRVKTGLVFLFVCFCFSFQDVYTGYFDSIWSRFVKTLLMISYVKIIMWSFLMLPYQIRLTTERLAPTISGKLYSCKTMPSSSFRVQVCHLLNLERYLVVFKCPYYFLLQEHLHLVIFFKLDFIEIIISFS